MLQPSIHFSYKELWDREIIFKTQKPYVMVERKRGKTINQQVYQGDFKEVTMEELLEVEKRKFINYT